MPPPFPVQKGDQAGLGSKSSQAGRPPSWSSLALSRKQPLLREALEEEGKDVGDFGPQGGRCWEEGVWRPWRHILLLRGQGRGVWT